MKIIGNLKELSEQINTKKKIKGYVSCSQDIEETGYIEITGVNTNNWWITTGRDFMRKSFSCCPTTSVYAHLRKKEKMNFWKVIYKNLTSYKYIQIKLTRKEYEELKVYTESNLIDIQEAISIAIKNFLKIQEK